MRTGTFSASFHRRVSFIVRNDSSMQVGFTALREFVVQRPSLRAEALNVLLELTTHPGMVSFKLPYSST
jgi:hypothetical protein